MFHHQKGTQVNHTTRSAQAPSLRTGLFATRGASAKGSGASSLRLLAPLALGLAALLALVAIPASALAARGHVYDESLVIGTPCTAEPCGPGELKEPSGLAVNEATHDIYVVDKGNDRVQVFSSRGALA
jgi:DNA-binding beta-propeller fold protein YncE